MSIFHTVDKLHNVSRCFNYTFHYVCHTTLQCQALLSLKRYFSADFRRIFLSLYHVRLSVGVKQNILVYSAEQQTLNLRKIIKPLRSLSGESDSKTRKYFLFGSRVSYIHCNGGCAAFDGSMS